MSSSRCLTPTPITTPAPLHFHRAVLIKLCRPCVRRSAPTGRRCVCLRAKGHCVGGFHYQNPQCRGRKGGQPAHESAKRQLHLLYLASWSPQRSKQHRKSGKSWRPASSFQFVAFFIYLLIYSIVCVCVFRVLGLILRPQYYK